MANQDVFRRLDQLSWRSDSERRIGHKGKVLRDLSRAGMPVPTTWVLSAEHFEAACGRILPRKHDLRSLIKLSGTRTGDERCARAYEEIMAAPFDEALLEGFGLAWEESLSTSPHGLAVRPAIAASGRAAHAAGRQLHTRVGLSTRDDVIEAIREVWASAVLAWSVAAYAEANLRDLGLAVLLQPTVSTATSGLLTRTTSAYGRVGAADWHLGVLLDDDGPTEWRRRGQLLLPLSLGRGGAAPPEPLARLRRALEPDGFEQLIELGEIGERELGEGAVLYFSVEREDGRCQLHVLNAEKSPRWLPLVGGTASTTWVEIPLGGQTPEPPTRLTQSVVERTIDGALRATMTELRCRVDEAETLITHWSGRSYLNVDALTDTLRNVPFLDGEDLLIAFGGVSGEQRRRLAVVDEARGVNLFRWPRIGVAALSRQMTFESDLERIERDLERDIRGQSAMDVSLLPSDAMDTTLRAAEDLIERAAGLWMRCSGATLALHLAIRALIRRRVADVDRQVGYVLAAGEVDVYASTMTEHLARVVRALHDDAPALAFLREHAVVRPEDLPDGVARGALGHFLARYGELCFNPFELSRPRWNEDARTLAKALSILVDQPELISGEAAARRARAAADHELARYEPELTGLERRILRGLVDRMREQSRHRAHADQLLLRAVALFRRVALDVERRLRRIDPELRPEGPFHCSATRLRRALKSGRPELSRVIRMRTVERYEQAAVPAPPVSFVGSPPRGGIPLVPAAELEGIGVSPGVVEGRIVQVGGPLPDRLGPDDILVMSAFEIAHAPLGLAAKAIITETGGALAPGAEAVRNLGRPAVFSVENAGLRLNEGERVRLDGERGTITRLDIDRDAPPLSMRAEAKRRP